MASWLGDFQVGYDGVGVMGEADSVGTVGGLQFAGCDQVSLRIGRDYRAIDGAGD